MMNRRVHVERKSWKKRKRTTRQQLPTLPDELILHIMLWLPASSLVRFKRVCNSWRTLISSPEFIKEHHQRYRSLPLGLSLPRLAYYTVNIFYHGIGVFPVKPLFKGASGPATKVVTCGNQHCHILCSCEGLLVLRYSYGEDSRVRLWNPCTGLASETLNFGFLFSFWGFGYDHVHDQYKLFGAGRENGAKILTFDSNLRWRTIPDPPMYSCQEGRFLKGTGTLYWIVGRLYSDSLILSLDLEKETYGTLSLPPHRDADDSLCHSPFLCVLRDCLAVCFDDKKTHWAVWIMKEYGVHESWTRLMMIPHRYFYASHPLEPLYLSEDDDVLLAVHQPDRLFLCNLKDGSLDFPMVDSSSDDIIEDPMSVSTGTRNFCVYHESLLSPAHLGLRTGLSEMPFLGWSAGFTFF